ncbi:MAG: peptidoglycan-associated lipoprotein Pal [Candidatus Hydrogenedentota bacterium]
MKKKFVVLTCMLSAMVLVAGCKGKKGDDLNQGTDSSSGGPESTTGSGLPEIDENTIFGPSGLQPIYFDYDSFSLRSDALEALRRNADMLSQLPNVVVQVEGHCDERGTQEYNLALGEKRALATREHLIKLGISGNRIVTISYGEEDPADAGQSESSWAKNRRCEFNKAM